MWNNKKGRVKAARYLHKPVVWLITGARIIKEKFFFSLFLFKNTK
jgi:hypothetical protein